MESVRRDSKIGLRIRKSAGTEKPIARTRTRDTAAQSDFVLSAFRAVVIGGFKFIAVAALLGSSLHAISAPDEWSINTVRDARVVGKELRVGPDGIVQWSGGTGVPLREVVAIERSGSPPSALDDRPHVLLVSGDRIAGRLIAIERERLRFLADLGAEQELTIPLTDVSAVWLTARSAGDSAQPELRRWLAQRRRQDVVRLANGDSETGTIVAAAADGAVKLERNRAAAEVPLDRIDALVFGNELARPFRPRSLTWRMALRQGSRLAMNSLTIDADWAAGETYFGAMVRFPAADVSRLQVFGGAAVYLSDLPALREESRPFFGVSWPMMRDRSVTGRDLRLGGGVIDKGLGLHSAARVSWAVPPGAIRFETLAGLDEATGRLGSATIRITAADVPLPHGSVELAGGQPPKELRLDLPPGARELTIEVELGSGGDVQDHVNLGDARFIVPSAEKP